MENQEREGLGLCSLSFQERGAGDPPGPNLAGIWLSESQKMGSSWCVQAFVLLALVSDTKLVKMRVEPFPWRCKNSYLWNAVWLYFLCFALWVIIFPLLPTTTHKKKKKKRGKNSILESLSAKVKIKNGQKYSSKACITMTDMIFKVEIGSMWWGLELWENPFLF